MLYILFYLEHNHITPPPTYTHTHTHTHTHTQAFFSFGGGYPEFGGHPHFFFERYSCYPMVFSTKNSEEIKHGGKIIMPSSALEKLARLNISYPMLFKLSNKNRSTHCGVLEFVAEEGRIYIPHWVRACGCLFFLIPYHVSWNGDTSVLGLRLVLILEARHSIPDLVSERKAWKQGYILLFSVCMSGLKSCPSHPSSSSFFFLSSDDESALHSRG